MEDTEVREKEERRYEDGAVSAKLRMTLAEPVKGKTVIEKDGWVCRWCGRGLFEQEHMAKYCCATSVECKTEGCTNRTGKSYMHCDDCRHKRDADKEAAALDRAEEVPYEGGMVIFGYSWYDDMEHLTDYLSECDEPVEWPEFIFASRATQIMIPSAESLIENELEDIHTEDPDLFSVDCCAGLDKLNAAIDEFHKANRNLVYFDEDRKHKYRVLASNETQPNTEN